MARTAPAPPSVVAEPPAATRMCVAPALTAAATIMPVPYVLADRASAGLLRAAVRPLAWATSTTAVPSAASPMVACSGSPQELTTSTVTGTVRRLRQSASKVPSPPSATGSCVAGRPPSLTPAAMAAATSAAV